MLNAHRINLELMLHWYLADRAISCRRKEVSRKKCAMKLKEACNNFAVFFSRAQVCAWCIKLYRESTLQSKSLMRNVKLWQNPLGTWWEKRETFNVAETRLSITVLSPCDVLTAMSIWIWLDLSCCWQRVLPDIRHKSLSLQKTTLSSDSKKWEV